MKGDRAIRLCALGIGILGGVLLGAPASAGGLTPPVGPVAPTMKTLTEIEPRIIVNATNTPGDADSKFRIAASGTYYLTGDIVVAAGTSGIEIALSSGASVTLDLNGFTVSAGGAGTLSGIVVNGSGSVAIRNGHVRGFGVHGINAMALNTVIEDVNVRTCTQACIRGYGAGTIRDCYAEGSGATGISLEGGNFLVERCISAYCVTGGFEGIDACVFDDCMAIENTGFGFAASDGGVIRGCLAYHNGSYGFVVGEGASLTSSTALSNDVGVSTASNARVEDVSCSDSVSYGVYLGIGSFAKNVVSASNAWGGFICAARCTLEGCVAIGNSAGYGFDGNGGNCTFTSCIAIDNLSGYRLGNQGRAIDCESKANADAGFESGGEVVLSECRARGNTGAGFEVGTYADISRCSATENGAHGFIGGDGVKLGECTAAGNNGDGFQCLDAAMITGCRSADNTGLGIFVSNGAHVEGNTVRNNTLAGISVNFSSRVSGNTLNGNGTAAGNQGGIVVLGRQNQIVDNTLSFDDVGIIVTGTRNFIARNTAGESAVANYSIASGNSFGPIVNVAGVGDISGTANANHPQANFQR